MDRVDYTKLYALQDRVMDVVFSVEECFYLTGGTCLSRFYQEKRYSDDLDFFAIDANSFSRVMRETRVKLHENFSVREEVVSKDFVRLIIDDLLQLDFVNDRTPRYKEVVYLKNGYIIDNYENILANKLTAVISRDSAKDIFDIFLIDKFYDVDYKKILEVAHEKAYFSDDALIIRLKTFPLRLLQNISLVDKGFLDNFDVGYKALVEKIEM